MRCATTALFLSMVAQGGFAMSFNLESNAFNNGGDIPQKFTCDGTDVSPPLVWGDAPSGTKSLALIADDPDAPAGTWVHWVMYDIEPQTVLLREGVAKTESIPGTGKQGLNDFGKIGYGGPCPPRGKSHRYYFKLFALDTKLNLRHRATKRDVEQAMKGHILAQTELMGRYKRTQTGSPIAVLCFTLTSGMMIFLSCANNPIPNETRRENADISSEVLAAAQCTVTPSYGQVEILTPT
jgi:Raf kinase inhibitor-like YbhB/YbcL family protein